MNLYILILSKSVSVREYKPMRRMEMNYVKYALAIREFILINNREIKFIISGVSGNGADN
ncbi:hypothetical protein A7K99_12410 [Tatumella citrea]|uniref:Uncharacterized protein n=1 Tax=Tatumella citrea TaxID=53336 RepID=A0A1Y0L9Y0_TATCI|nr:hypothetical protein A7K98_12415 [Tatumella citrea]ARU98539.1 hypothetical protein A7K99_12410 [Tatumella citrea]